MANRATAEAILQFGLNIGNPALRTELLDRGFEDLSTLYRLKESAIAKMCDTIRRPGGTIPNPNPGPGQPAEIRNPGIDVSSAIEEQLIRLRYLSQYFHDVGRVITQADVTDENLDGIYEMYDMAKDVNNAAYTIPDKFNSANARASIEAIDYVLSKRIGRTCAPLSYLTRAEVEPPANDPGVGQPTFKAEMIRRTIHTGAPFQHDNGELFDIIQQVTKDTDAWPHVKPHKRGNDGRSAYLTMKAHYMGRAFQATTAAQADAVLSTIQYAGDKRNFPFDKFISRMMEAFNDKALAGEPYTEEQKVRKLISAITDPRLDATGQAIENSDTHNSNFDLAVARFRTQYNKLQAKDAAIRRVADVSTAKGGPGRGFGGRGRGKGGRSGRGGGRGRGGAKSFDPNNPGRTLDSDTWRKLDEATKQKVREARNNKKRQAGQMQTGSNQRVRFEDTPSAPAPAATDTSVGASMTRR